jgi:hypothetical protein
VHSDFVVVNQNALYRFDIRFELIPVHVAEEANELLKLTPGPGNIFFV